MATKQSPDYPATKQLIFRLIIGFLVVIFVLVLVLWGLSFIFGPLFAFIGKYVSLGWIWKLLIMIIIIMVIWKIFSKTTLTMPNINWKLIRQIATAVVVIIALYFVWQWYENRRPDAESSNELPSDPGKSYVDQEYRLIAGVPFKFVKMPGKSYTFYCKHIKRIISLNPIGDDDHYVSGVVDNKGFHVISGEDPKVNGLYSALIDTTSVVTLRITDVQ